MPEPVDVEYAVLLGPPPIRAYPREAAIAEKLHAMVLLADANRRFKDLFDVYALGFRFAVAGQTPAAAISATFSRRKSVTFSAWRVPLTTGFYAAGSARRTMGSLSEAVQARGWACGFRARRREDSGIFRGTGPLLSNGEHFTSSYLPGGPRQ